MVTLGRIARWYFGVQAITVVLTVYAVLRVAIHLRASADDPPPTLSLVTAGSIIGVLFLQQLVCGLAWWALLREWRTARGWAMAASLIVLPLFPIGTAAGVAGLMAFVRSGSVQAVAAERRRRPDPVQGDGTSRAFEWLALALQIAWIWVACGWFEEWGAQRGLVTPGALGWVAQFGAAMLLSIAIHEMGHVLGGWASAMKLHSLYVGPFHWRKREGRWTFEFVLSGLAGKGAAGLVPASLRDVRSRAVFVTALGPVASLLLAGFAAILLFTAKGRPWQSAWHFLALLAALAAADFVINLIPLRPERHYSDGARIYQLVKGGPWADVDLAFSMVASSLVTALRPRLWDGAVIERAADFLKGDRRATLLHLYAYLHHMDSWRMDAAGAHLRLAEQGYEAAAAEGDAKGIEAEFIFFHALIARDSERAHFWWRKLETHGESRKGPEYWKAYTAMLLLHGRYGEARTALQAGRQAVDRLPDAGGYEFDRWCISRLERALADADPRRAATQPSPAVA